MTTKIEIKGKVKKIEEKRSKYATDKSYFCITLLDFELGSIWFTMNNSELASKIKTGDFIRGILLITKEVEGIKFGKGFDFISHLTEDEYRYISKVEFTKTISKYL